MQDLQAFQGIRIARYAPPISHLFFADDAMFFLEGNRTGIDNIKLAIVEYCDASGQIINKQKSSLIFSPNTTLDIARYSYNSFGISASTPVGKYLRVPLEVNRNSKQFYNNIYDGVARRICSWNGSLLSPAGRLTLITSVLASLSVHLLSVFKIPVSVANRINKLFAHFWWAGTRHCKTIHWRSSRYLSLPKKEGGLGIRDINCLNQALLAKMGWRVMNCSATLVSKFLSSKYHCNALTLSELLSKFSHNCSWGWKSIKWGLQLVLCGMAWLPGKPSSIDLSQTRWALGETPRVKDGCPLPPPTNISDLLDSSGSWSYDKLCCYYDDPWVNKIMSCQIPRDGNEDYYYWRRSTDGKFSVKSAYLLAFDTFLQNNSVGPPLDLKLKSFCGKLLWKLRGPAKLKTFLWKILNNALPIGSEFRKRGLPFPSECPLCNLNYEESLEHLFRDCPLSSRLWLGSDLGIRTDMSTIIDLRHWIVEWISYLWTLDKDWSRITQFVLSLWTIWIARNKAKFHGLQLTGPVLMAILNSQLSGLNDFITGRDSSLESNMKGNDMVLNKVKAGQSLIINGPGHGCSLSCIKVDGAWKDLGRAAGGWIAHSFSGTCITRSFASFRAASPLHAEANTLLHATLWAKEEGLLHIHILSDCLSLVQQIGGVMDVSPEICRIAAQIQNAFSSFHCVHVSFIPRQFNKEAHDLAAMGIRS